MMDAPTMCFLAEKCTCMNLPKRDELLLRTVLALPASRRFRPCERGEQIVSIVLCQTGQAGAVPKASRIVLASMICCSTQSWLVVTAVRYCRISLVDSVLPAPDSPAGSIQ